MKLKLLFSFVKRSKCLCCISCASRINAVRPMPLYELDVECKRIFESAHYCWKCHSRLFCNARPLVSSTYILTYYGVGSIYQFQFITKSTEEMDTKLFDVHLNELFHFTFPFFTLSSFRSLVKVRTVQQQCTFSAANGKYFCMES